MALYVLFVSTTLFGQFSFGLKMDGGLSKIPSTFNLTNTIISNQVGPSAQVGLFFNQKLSEKHFATIELLFLQIEAKQIWRPSEGVINGSDIGTKILEPKIHISYIGLPLSYGFAIEKFLINVGFQVSFHLRSYVKEEVSITYSDYDVNWENSYSLNIDDYDFGPKIGLAYKLNEKISVEGSYYYGTKNIAGSNVEDYKWSIRQAAIGLAYSFVGRSTAGP